MSKHNAELLTTGLPARINKGRNAMMQQLDRKDLRTLVRLLTKLRGYFELPETFKPIDGTLEIVHALSEDFVRQAAERRRHKDNRTVRDSRQKT